MENLSKIEYKPYIKKLFWKGKFWWKIFNNMTLKSEPTVLSLNQMDIFSVSHDILYYHYNNDMCVQNTHSRSLTDLFNYTL